jgi:hypothetical protein
VADVGVLILGTALVIGISGATMVAQRGGGGGGSGGGGGRNSTPIICVHNCPAIRGGLSSEDDLKNFRRAMEVQATEEQRAAFAKVAQYAQAASDRLKDFHESVLRESVVRESSLRAPVVREAQGKEAGPAPLADRASAVDQAIEQARASNQNFLSSFSSGQKSGLKDSTAKLAKADSELDTRIKALDKIVESGKPEGEQIGNAAASLAEEFASFQSEQLALGREMGILMPADGQAFTFNLPKVTNSIKAGGQTISIAASGAASRTSAENGRNVFSLKLAADLSDVQQNITAILRSRLTRSPRCGERVEVRQATLTPVEPASLVVARVHYERWICPPGQSEPLDAAAGDGTIEVKLTPTVEANGGLGLVSEISGVEADGLLRGLLRSGDLGVTLREQIAASLVPFLQKAADLKATLPLTAQESASIQKALFQNGGADQLNLVLEGQMELSDEQTTQFAAQLKQRVSAQSAPAP